MTTTILISALLLGQPLQTKQGLDPYLWPELEPLVTQAAEMERDPKRGPGNALELLESKRREMAADERLRVGLDLRIAAIAIRQRIMTSEQFPRPARLVQALSTYARLDLREPGLAEALQAALASRADRAPPSLEIKAAFLGRNPELKLEPLIDRFRQHLSQVGVRLKVIPPRDAPYLIKFGVQSVPSQDERRNVRARLDVEAREMGRVEWRSGLFRTTAARTVEDALTASLEWLVRIGGRDLLFRYLAEGPLPELAVLFQRPGGHGHGHEGHGH